MINTPARVAPQNNTNVDDSTRTVAEITPCRHNDDDNVLVYLVPTLIRMYQFIGSHQRRLSFLVSAIRMGTMCIRLLSEVQRSEDGYTRFITDIEKKPLTTKQIFLFRKTCMYLRTAYTIALEKLGHNKHTWVNTCCKEAVEMVAYLGLDYTSDPKRVSEWNRLFRRNGKFCHPNNYIANGIKQPKPKIFALFPKAASAMVNEFILSRLDHITSEMVQYELISKIIPALKDEAAKEKGAVEYDYISGLVEKPPSKLTVLRWMHGHEKEEQVQHRSKFINTYLSEIELFTHRWVQMPLTSYQTVQSLICKDEQVISAGHKYWNNVTNEWWMEFHVDDHNFENCNIGPYGGNLSVRMPEGCKPIIIFGQDESIFNQFSSRGRQWTGPTGQRAIMLKSSGVGLMISAFQSREVGLINISDVIIVFSLLFVHHLHRHNRYCHRRNC